MSACNGDTANSCPVCNACKHMGVSLPSSQLAQLLLAVATAAAIQTVIQPNCSDDKRYTSIQRYLLIKYTSLLQKIKD